MARKSGTRARVSAHPNPVPVSYPGKNDKGVGMEQEQWTACRDMLDAIYKARDGSMCDIFCQLPDEEEYADYYEAIPEPECLDNIAARLSEAGGFTAPELFYKQLHLVFLNAMHYNEESSQLWDDAKSFETMISEAWRAHASAGTFASNDPYHKGTARQRKGKAAGSTEPKPERASATPNPVTPGNVQTDLPAAAAPIIHLRLPRPEAPPSPAAHPSSAEQTTARSMRTREPRGPVVQSPSAPSVRTKSSPPKSSFPAAPQASSSGLASGAPSPLAWFNLSPADASVIQSLDSQLPRWDGPQTSLPGDPAPGGIPGSGWWGEGAPDFERSVGGPASYRRRIQTAAEAIAGYKDPRGYVLSEIFGSVPDAVESLNISSPSSPGFGTILLSARAGKYSSLLHFDLDMTRLFEKSRRWFQGRAEEYGRVLTLQRLYSAITAPYPMPLSPNVMPPPSRTLFASLPTGPGRARTVQDAHEALRGGASQEQAGFGITTTRILTKDRLFTEEARHKGVAYRCGDFVHLINPDDGSRPIVGQIFKTFVPTKGYPTHHVTVCWYFRPEQTVHPAEQQFVEHEVFKTGHFCDHPVEDIIEKVTVQPTESASRGRPKGVTFYPGWPLYVCSARYLDKPCIFMRIKKWANILPEQMRLSDMTAVFPFQHQIVLPVTKSPFVLGVRGPGGLGRPKRQPIPADDEEAEAAIATIPVPVSRRPSEPGLVDPTQQIPAPAVAPQRYMVAPAAAPPPAPSRTPSTGSFPAQQRPAAQQRPSQQWQTPMRAQAPLYPARNFATIVGGAQVLEQVAVREFLPSETARLFEQDARHQVLWFSGPPLAQGAVRIPAPPAHSLEYLTYLSKRKRGASQSEARPEKRLQASRNVESGNVTEGETESQLDGDISRHWWAQGMTADQVLDSLAAVC